MIRLDRYTYEGKRLNDIQKAFIIHSTATLTKKHNQQKVLENLLRSVLRCKKLYGITKVMKFSLTPFYSYGNREKVFRKPFGSVFATIPDILGVYTLCKRGFDRGAPGFKCLLDVARGWLCTAPVSMCVGTWM